MYIPTNIKSVLTILNNANYEAYVVGGCVRDSLLNHEPHDWDITTNATPDQIRDVFKDYKLVNNNGEKHGTITVMFNNEQIEITTYRTESEYSDHRHPDEVKFVSTLKEDLSRRDFTINAMAADKDGNIVDYFDGEKDLKYGILKCVGDPYKRFNEDALRILRALRFASVYNLVINELTERAMFDNRFLLEKISAERIQSELCKMIEGVRFTTLMRNKIMHSVLCAVIPELSEMWKFDQHSRYHKHDLWEHTLSVVDNVPAYKNIKLAALFHDVGKLYSIDVDKNNLLIYHYPNHAENSYEIAKRVLNILKFSNEDQKAILFLIRYHDYEFSEKRAEASLKKFMNLIPYEDEDDKKWIFHRLITLRKADRVDHIYTKPIINLDTLENKFNSIIDNKECFNLKSLALNGNDLIELGFSGRRIGELLHICLDAVINNEVENEKYALLKFIVQNT